MSLIQLKNVEYRYKKDAAPALQNIDLEIGAGEFVSIIGANGSGKSTLAKLLNVLLLPTAGQIKVGGLDTSHPENVWPIRQRVGMVFQNPDNQLVATMVEDDVAFGPENLGIPSAEIRARVDSSLKMVGMDGFQRYAPHNLSGGQKQRVAIAGLIAMEPDCLVLDEATAMLDPKGREEVMDTISYLNQEKDITCIHITHFMEEAARADRIVVLRNGKLVKDGSPAEIFRDIKTIKELSLDVPVAVELAEYLRDEGLSIPEILTIDELVDALC